MSNLKGLYKECCEKGGSERHRYLYKRSNGNPATTNVGASGCVSTPRIISPIHPTQNLLHTVPTSLVSQIPLPTLSQLNNSSLPPPHTPRRPNPLPLPPQNGLATFLLSTPPTTKSLNSLHETGTITFPASLLAIITPSSFFAVVM